MGKKRGTETGLWEADGRRSRNDSDSDATVEVESCENPDPAPSLFRLAWNRVYRFPCPSPVAQSKPFPSSFPGAAARTPQLAR